MSFTGKNPKFDFLNTAPQSVDPSNPQEGDIFYSDGTPRDEGLWIYQDADWQQFSTGATLSTVANLTLTPQSADPGTPAEGMLFRADGTSRAEGIWEYRDGGWVQITGQRSSQEFAPKDAHYAIVATTANINLATQCAAGNVLNGVTLVQNDIILIKNQTTSSDNGLYCVAATGAPTRHPLYSTADSLTNARIFVSYGTVGGAKYWYQTATLTSLSDSQTWVDTYPVQNFTVPAGVYKISYTAVGGGGGGGGGKNNGSGSPVGISGAGGAGGSGAQIVRGILDVSPGEILNITIGAGGVPGYGSTNGTAGGATTIVSAAKTIQCPGGAGGAAGTISTANNTGGGVAVDTFSTNYPPLYLLGSRGGNGGNSQGGNAYGRYGNVGLSNLLEGTSGGAAGMGGPNQGNDNFAGGSGGGGGGASLEAGGSGGHGGGPYLRCYDVTGVSRTSNIVTITMSTNYGYNLNPVLPGDFVYLTGISASHIGGQRAQVIDAPSSTTFRYYAPGPDGVAADQTGLLDPIVHHASINVGNGAGGGGGGGAGGNYVHDKAGNIAAPGGSGYVKLEW